MAPAAFGLLLLIPVIVVLYLLRLRRTEQVVSSTYLWRRMVRDLEANAPWQRLRRNLLLLLQLLTLIALILALARPFTWAEGAGGETAILVLDTSASMAARDVTPSRLEAAKTLALRYVEDLPDGARVTVIAASDGARVLASSSQDRRQVRLAIQSARIGQPGWGSDLSAALELAAAVAAQQPDVETVLYSDGRVVLPEYLALRGRVRYLPMGLSGENQGIGALTLQPAPGGRRTAFVQVTNYGRAPVQRRLVLSSVADGVRQTLNAYDLDLEPDEARAIVAEDLPAEITAVEAQLLGTDVLAVDDRAWAVHVPSEPARVTLVTEGNLFLETGLGLLPNLEVTAVRPGDWEAGRPKESESGGEAANEVQPTSLPALRPPTLTIFDGYVPITATLPPGNLFFIAPPRSTEVFSVTGQVQQPAPRAVSGGTSGDAGDPLLAHVDVADVGVQQANRVALPAWARPVILGDVAASEGASTAAPRTVPLLWAGEQDGRRIAVLAFDLRRSDLALQVAFPLLLANLTGWLAPSGSSALPAQVLPGAALSLSLPPDVQSVQLTRPDGSQVDVAVRGGQAALAETGTLGIYRVRWGGSGQAAFAVNLFAPSESDLEPVGSLALGTGEVEGGGAPSTTDGARREWWRPLAMVALLVLFLEWLVYYRATLARLWARARAAFTRGAR